MNLQRHREDVIQGGYRRKLGRHHVQAMRKILQQHLEHRVGRVSLTVRSRRKPPAAAYQGCLSHSPAWQVRMQCVNLAQIRNRPKAYKTPDMQPLPSQETYPEVEDAANEVHSTSNGRSDWVPQARHQQARQELRKTRQAYMYQMKPICQPPSPHACDKQLVLHA